MRELRGLVDIDDYLGQIIWHIAHAPSPFTSGTAVTKAELDALVNAINALPRGFIGESTSLTAVTLATSGGAMFASPNKVTFTLTATRRVRIVAQAAVLPERRDGSNERPVRIQLR